MHLSASTAPDGFPPPPISSQAVNSARILASQENGINGRTSSSLAGGGESKLSSSSSPPKSQEFSSVSFSNLTPNNGNSIPGQAQQQQGHEHRSSENPSPSGDGFLHWGQKKRSKRTVGDKFSGGRIMAPPPPPPGVGVKGGTKLRSTTNGGFSSKDPSSSLRNRSLEDGARMGGGAGGSPPSTKTHQDAVSRPISSRSTVGKRSEKSDSKKPAPSASFGGPIRKEKPTESLTLQSDHHTHLTSAAPEAESHHGKGAAGEVVEWPRIYIALSRKEKEDDFFTMKGTKLPHRPKKRAKAIDRSLQYCFPGMWLSDLSRARYEVRERKSVKKPRRRGLKGLDSMESDSE